MVKKMVIAEFRLAFSEFANTDLFPDADIKMAYQESLIYFQQEHDQLNDDHRRFMIMLMTAHLLKIRQSNQSGDDLAITTSASVGSVSVSALPSPNANRSQWSWWLSLTSYGQRLSVLLHQLNAGGFYYGGRRTRSALRL